MRFNIQAVLIITSVDARASLGASLRELGEAAAVCTASNAQIPQRCGDGELNTIAECKAWQGDRCKANHGFTRTLHALND